ncbi:MAG: sugar isomerase, partial [Verrucomicrobia bacterium]|nr:sugar isomerase [Verrucomicrobiota bacterium]
MPASAASQLPTLTRRPPIRLPLKVQPVLIYSVPKRREAWSWRNWGGIQTEADAKAEKERLTRELAKLKAKADFPVEFLPLVMLKDGDPTEPVAKGAHDVMLMYAAGGGVKMLESLTLPDKWNLMFLRHSPGPVYLWYEIVSPRFLRKMVDQYGQAGMDVHDVVTDEYSELAWRLRALYGLKNTLGKKMIAIGGPGGWGAGGRKAPTISRETWKMDLVDYPYKELGPRIERARANGALVKRCQDLARRYLGQGGISLHTKRQFVENAFVLREVFNDILDEAKTDAITVHACMGTIMPMSQTTACLVLTLLNDEGYLAFCESDFVVIPSGVLLHYISGLPVFLNDPTYPHGNIVTLAHCTAPRKMDGKRYERTKVMTHFESDYGAAPKVEMKIGQITTNLVPDFDCKKWIGFLATIVGNPFLDICRSQIDVRVHGDSNALMEDMKGFHWMLSYGDFMKETAYALKKVGIGWQNIS